MSQLLVSKEPASRAVDMKSGIKLDSGFVVEAVIRLMKRDISERYKMTGKVTDEDREFCEKIDWHPVDELPLKEEFVESLKETVKGSHSRMTLDELDKLMGLK